MKVRTAARVGIACMVMASAGLAMAQGPGQASDAPGKAPASGAQARPADRQLAKDVRRAIRKAGGVDMAALSVRVKSGVVTLPGSVPSAIEASKAAEVAKGVSGVTDVRNKLTVQTEEN
ncbi:BON domain-containing protein [Burkholderia multivorans]|uniref:BON domain-containing protein n=1 Tax=Burkholderia multivorans TaxID=87883 RepID=UPI0020B27298|nr:BON domain-containing protein [Burkholderia multivorans]